MKTTFKSLIYSFLFICLCLTANAQTYTDSVRVGVGLEAITTTGIFGTGVNIPANGTATSPYKYGVGASLRVDVPIIDHINVTANIGYNNYFASSTSNTSQETISPKTLPNFETLPVKLGIKYFFGKAFYLQGEAGETLLINKDALYALYSYSFTYSPAAGVLIPLKKRRTYIDAGVRFESAQSFYNDNAHNNFWALHVAYLFNL